MTHLLKYFGKPRLPGQKITKFHKNLAFNVQFRLEEIVKLLVRKYMRSNKQKNLCLAGGVHMNCKLNGELSKLKKLKIYLFSQHHLTMVFHLVLQ